MPPAFFPDNSVVINFAHADELAVLRDYLRGNGRVVEAVSYEISMSARHVPRLASLNQAEWFGEPIEFSGASDVRAIEGIRVGIFGGATREPLQHLGESQTLHLLRTDSSFSDATWITEDRDAYDFAVAQHIRVRDSFGLLLDLVGFQELTPSRAYAVCEKILAAGRPLLRVPASARDFA